MSKSSSPAAEAPHNFMQRVLDAVEKVGNKVPHPVVIFVILIGIVVVLSHVLHLFGSGVTYDAYNVETGEIEQNTLRARSLLTLEGIRFMFVSVVPNFMGFNAVGVIIVAMLGVGVAEEAGLVKALIRKLVIVSPRALLTYILVFVGILSSIAADAGYLVLIPLAGVAYASVGRHPIAGLGAGFAAVASAFTVNIVPKPLDGILTEITNDAIALAEPDKSIDLMANFWFSVGSVVVLTVLIALITDRIIEPRLGKYGGGNSEAAESLTPEERRGLKFALLGLVGVIAFFALLTLPPGAPLRNAETGAILGNSPLMSGLIVVITIVFLVCGAAYGFGAGTMKNSTDIINAMTKAVAGLAGLLFLLFVISQFIALFNYSHMATIAAVKLADILTGANLDALWLLLGFIVVVFALDLIITGAIPKWAIFAPLFVPLLMRLNVDPEAVLAAYRVGDSPMNSITPLNAYFALVVTFCQKYQKDAGVGTVVALMLILLSVFLMPICIG
ncbi:MAG TPA: AbgT family transporter, partial [Verrucomicrobiota bacterium]|nr:AbgT family transporter [Verrucomicrobiota bacterium]